MNMNTWSKKFLWFISGAMIAGFMSFVSSSEAQQSQFVKLIMRFGEERILDDGTKVGVTKGENETIVVTLSKSASSPSSTSSSRNARIKIGTYKAAATTNSTTGTIRIKIKSVDQEGNIKADFKASNGLYGEGSLAGNVNARGELRLTGEMVTTLFGVTRWRLVIVASVEDEALVNGRYSYEDVVTGVEGRGEFSRANFEEEL